MLKLRDLTRSHPEGTTVQMQMLRAQLMIDAWRESGDSKCANTHTPNVCMLVRDSH